MSGESYFDWNHVLLRVPPIIDGWQMSDCFVSFDAQKPRAGTAIEMLEGGSVYQRTPRQANAPLDLEPETYSFSVQAGIEEDYFHVRRLFGTAHYQPVQVFLEDPIEDVWVIPSYSRSLWVLSRFLPFGTVAYAGYAPQAWIADNPRSGSAQEELTVINTGTAVANEIYVSDFENASTVQTGDLSAHAGRLLILRYHPLRELVLDEFTRAIGEPGKLEWKMSMTERIPNRDY